jgi:predicted metal-binding membrane protein
MRDRLASTLKHPDPASGEALSAAPPLSRFHRISLVAAILVLTASGWAYLGYQDWAMRHMDRVDMAMPGAGSWSPADLVIVFVMWSVMMVAMMLPSAIPMLAAYRRLAGAASTSPGTLTALFGAGYVLIWTAFSAAATLAQWAMHSALLVSPAMRANPLLSAALLIAAGVYQWAPLKQTCLAGCASPLQFLSGRWRGGKTGAALWMGLLHGAYCVGCCWLLMALLFVYGVMNIVWIAAISLYVLAEKTLPPMAWLPRVTGTLLIGWGIALALLSWGMAA